MWGLECSSVPGRAIGGRAMTVDMHDETGGVRQGVHTDRARLNARVGQLAGNGDGLIASTAGTARTGAPREVAW
jgi:hypothetical protein